MAGLLNTSLMMKRALNVVLAAMLLWGIVLSPFSHACQPPLTAEHKKVEISVVAEHGHCASHQMEQADKNSSCPHCHHHNCHCDGDCACGVAVTAALPVNSINIDLSTANPLPEPLSPSVRDTVLPPEPRPPLS
ncbi:MAG: hypothetical protein ACWA44_10605 [Thiotrichales bacterium]